MTDGEILDKWLCAECYGRDVYPGFDHGVYSEVSCTLVSNTKMTLTFGNSSLDMLSRSTSKSASYKRDFFNNHGLVVGAIQDAQYVNFFRNTDDGCWSDGVDEYLGDYSLTGSFVNSQIYFADLREDILVYYEEHGSYGGAASGAEPLGHQLVYADFGGQGVGCKTIFIYDAIELDVTLSASGTQSERITKGSYAPYATVNSGSGLYKIAASDNSGYCGGVSFGCYGFGNYAVVDQYKPFDCVEGSYTELVSPESIFAFRNSWESSGTNTQMDSFDASTWADYTSGWDSNTYMGFADGTYVYPNFIDIQPLPLGSWVVDSGGNYFYSMITKDLQVFNRLNADDPNEVTKLMGNNIVFYPVGVS